MFESKCTMGNTSHPVPVHIYVTVGKEQLISFGDDKALRVRFISLQPVFLCF